MGKVFGYARVSTADQCTAIQEAALKAAGAGVVFAEKVTGTTRDGRGELAKVLGVLGAGDTLAVVRLDRLGRSLRDLANLADEIAKAGAHLRVLEQAVDTSTAPGRAFFGMLAVFAAFETDVRRERQAEGIAKARVEGVYMGRQPSIERDRVQALKAQGLGPAAIAKAMGISRQSVYRVLGTDAAPARDAVVAAQPAI
jgi:DNA invertase Pin-like site-specific DNA recombinase